MIKNHEDCRHSDLKNIEYFNEKKLIPETDKQLNGVELQKLEKEVQSSNSSFAVNRAAEAGEDKRPRLGDLRSLSN